jgi:signal transduction histidine kinase
MSQASSSESQENTVSMEEYLRVVNENKLLREVLDQLPSELVVVDPNIRFLVVNRAAVKDDELRSWMIGKTDFEFWQRKNQASELSKKRLAGCLAAVEQKNDFNVEEVFHAGTPLEKHYIRLHRPFFQENDLQFIVVYGQEVTELKKSEARLILQNAELEKVNHELDQFVYSASHNLRAPLLSVKGLLSLIDEEEIDPVSRKRFIGEIYKSIERLDATIKDIIEYSKNARLELIPRFIDIEQLIKNTYEDLKFYEGTTVMIEWTVSGSEPFYSDERRLKSIVHNIMSNSVKYSDPSKEASWLRISIEQNPTECTLAFTDNGKGISPENQSRVFEMFYRASSERSGSGLGLYIVKEMTERIGGSIELTSNLGVGTTLRLTLPNLANQPIA